MKEISIKEIPDNFVNNSYLCHMSGEILHNIGEVITLQHLEMMQKCGITSLLQFDIDEDPKDFKEKSSYKQITINELHDTEISPVNLTNLKKEIILSEGEKVTEQVIAKLQENNISTLYYKKDEIEAGTSQARKYKTLIDSEMINTLSEVETLEHPKAREERIKKEQEEALLQAKNEKLKNIEELKFENTSFFMEPSKEISQNLIKEAMEISENLQIKRQEASDPLPVHFTIENRPKEFIKESLSNYLKWIKNTELLFNNIKQGQQIKFDEILGIIKPIFQFFLEDAYFCINLTHLRSEPGSPTYVYSHSVNVCIYSIAIANHLGYDIETIVEIAANGLLHDIGHMLTFKPLFAKDVMDNNEQQKYDQHAIVGVSMLKNFDKVPQSIPYTILQHHENLNGSGRILHCNFKKLHSIARLVIVADRFERVSSLKSPLEAISRLLKSVKASEVDPKTFKALIEVNGFYPIGSLVIISGNIICKVIAANEKSIKEPVVKAIFKIESGKILEFSKEKQKTIDLSKVKGITIQKGFSHQAINSKISLGF